jgi:hypothetical protein
VKKGPASVTAIPWILVVLPVITLAARTAGINYPEARELVARSSMNLSVLFALGYGVIAAPLVSGI